MKKKTCLLLTAGSKSFLCISEIASLSVVQIESDIRADFSPCMPRPAACWLRAVKRCSPASLKKKDARHNS